MEVGRDQDSDLPEAVERNDYPIVVHKDGRQVQDGDQDGWLHMRQENLQPAPRDDSADTTKGEHPKFMMSRRRWIILSVVLLVAVILSAGLGAGLGFGLQPQSKQSNDTASQPLNASASTSASETTSATTSSSSTTLPSPTCPGVTSSLTGIACVSCNQSSSSNGGYIVDTGTSTTTFNELCNIDMPTGSAEYDPTTDTASITSNVTDINAFVAYSFIECMSQCARYNELHSAGSERNPCRAVTYGANLTDAIQAQGARGNCWLERCTWGRLVRYDGASK